MLPLPPLFVVVVFVVVVDILQAGLIATVISQLLDAGGMYCCFLSFTSSESDCELLLRLVYFPSPPPPRFCFVFT